MNTEDFPVENPPIEETIQDVEDEDTGSIEKELPKKKEKKPRTEAQQKAFVKAQAALKAKRERDRAEKEANKKPVGRPKKTKTTEAAPN